MPMAFLYSEFEFEDNIDKIRASCPVWLDENHCDASGNLDEMGLLS